MATCVPQACVYVNQTLDYYDESKDNEWEWEWDKGYEVMIHRYRFKRGLPMATRSFCK
jgi:hypothetical protein